MRISLSPCKPIALLALLALIGVMCLQAMPAAAVSQAASSAQGPATAPDDEGETPRVVEQEGDEEWPDFNTRRKGAPLVIAGVVAILAISLYFLVIKKPNNDAANTIVQLNSVPAGALIYYDTENTGRYTPATITNVTPVTHTIKLTLPGYRDYVTTFTISRGQTFTINAVLVKE